MRLLRWCSTSSARVRSRSVDGVLTRARGRDPHFRKCHPLVCALQACVMPPRGNLIEIDHTTKTCCSRSNTPASALHTRNCAAQDALHSARGTRSSALAARRERARARAYASSERTTSLGYDTRVSLPRIRGATRRRRCPRRAAIGSVVAMLMSSRRALLVGIVGVFVAASIFACGGDDEDDGTAGSATPASVFVPGEAPAQPALPPGAGQNRPERPSTPTDSGSTPTDSGSTPTDSGGSDAAPTDSGPG